MLRVKWYSAAGIFPKTSVCMAFLVLGPHDETVSKMHSAASDLGLHCLVKPVSPNT